MKIPSLVKDLQKFVDDNAPVILTVLGIVGVGATAVATHEAARKSVLDIQELERTVENPTKVQVVEATWKNYVLPVAIGVGTGTCMYMATRINLKRTAAIAGVYALSERSFAEYKDKVQEKFGEKKANEVDAEVAQKKVDQWAPLDQIMFLRDGNQPCMELFTGRPFQSNIEDIKHAQNRLNFQILHEDYASLSDLYSMLGLEPTQISDEIGWNNTEPLEITFETVLSPEGRPVLVMKYNVVPTYGYDNGSRL